MSMTMGYLMAGLFWYAGGYMLVGMVSEKVWELWAWHKVGQFWEYGVKKGYITYYPQLCEFLRWHNKAYTAIRFLFWPVVIPIQLVLRTKVLNRLCEKRYYY